MRHFLLSLSSIALLAACGGEEPEDDRPMAGGVGFSTDVEEIEDRQPGNPLPEEEEVETVEPRISPDAPRAGDYPNTGEATTRLPIEPGNEEPGGKDMLTDEERAEAIEDLEGILAADDVEDPEALMTGDDEVGSEEPPRN
jgi:hypothetical protein